MGAEGVSRLGYDRVPAVIGLDAIGFTGVLDSPYLRARRGRVRGVAASSGFRWNRADHRSPEWWPQGIALGEHEGGRVALVSWYQKPAAGRVAGTRVTVVDLSDHRRPRYRHVALVEPDPDGAMRAVSVHAGGIVWSGDRVLVSATFGGILEFRLDAIARADGRLVLPMHARYPQATTGDRLRYSFIAMGDDGDLVAGEYSPGAAGRLARVRLSAEGATVDSVWTPGIERMQGAVVRGGRWLVTASNGRAAGDFWTGTPGAMTRHIGALPPGPEDLALGMGRLWSLSEFPRKRWVFAIDVPLG